MNPISSIPDKGHFLALTVYGPEPDNIHAYQLLVYNNGKWRKPIDYGEEEDWYTPGLAKRIILWEKIMDIEEEG